MGRALAKPIVLGGGFRRDAPLPTLRLQFLKVGSVDTPLLAAGFFIPTDVNLIQTKHASLSIFDDETASVAQT
jgi:hypothetical protein